MESIENSALHKAELLRKRIASEPLWVNTSGESMGRAVGGGERILLASATTPRRGEIWAFVDAEGVLIVHRFRGRSGGRLWFRGDRNDADDVPVNDSLLVGRAIEVERRQRRSRLGTASRLWGRLWLDLDSFKRVFRSMLRL